MAGPGSLCAVSCSCRDKEIILMVAVKLVVADSIKTTFMMYTNGSSEIGCSRQHKKQ